MLPAINSNDTLLILNSMGIPLFSARGLTQTIEPIQQAKDQARTINGELIDLSESQFRKYQSKVSCTDMVGPAMNGIWPGQQIIIDCVCELAYKTMGGTPDRTVVSGSSRTSGDFTFYRPRLTMVVTQITQGNEEWAGTVNWELDLEEI